MRSLFKRMKIFLFGCTHKRIRETKWVRDGVCMVEHTCPDCHFHDIGHVYADPNNWE